MHLTHKNVASALDKLSRCLEDVKRWLSTNKLKLNPDKTKFIKRPTRDACLCMGDLQAPPAPHFVFLITL